MRTALALALAAALAACQRPRPSPEYREARERHAALLARDPLDAYARPEMAAVLELLERVPGGSSDAEPAAALRQRIQDERRAAAEEQARRVRLVEGAGAAPADAAFPAAWSAPGVAPPAAEAEAVTGAGRAPSALAAGTRLDDFRKVHGECFEARAPARLVQADGKSIQGEAWALRDDGPCRASHPAEVGRLVLFSAGQLVEVRDAADAKTEARSQRVEGTRRPDGSIALPEGTELPPGATVRWDPPAPPARPPVTRR